MARKKIVVTGDLTVDWLQWEIDPAPTPPNGCISLTWKHQKRSEMIALGGGAKLLARFMKAINKEADLGSPILDDIEKIPPEEIIHSASVLGKYFKELGKGEKPDTFRVSHFCGYSGPPIKPVKKDFDNDYPDADIVVIDDANNGFNADLTQLPRAILEGNKETIVVIKMAHTPVSNELWATVKSKKFKKLVVITSANNLRDAGVNISRRLSWERTVEDFMWQIIHNKCIADFRDCANLIIKIGIDGAIHYFNNEGKLGVHLYYDPKVVEDGYAHTAPGKMQGLTSAFTAALSSKILNAGMDKLGDGIREGILRSRLMQFEGFGDVKNIPDYQDSAVFHKTFTDEELAKISFIQVPPQGVLAAKIDGGWSILKDIASNGDGLEEAAFKAVEEGPKANFKGVPTAEFGKLLTVDRQEIESLHTIRNLMVDYLLKTSTDKPLCIAVFGQPGSGKSFGVKQLAKSIEPDKLKEIEFNVSQFESTEDLTIALSIVQSACLEGLIPLVFFDEFDSKFGDNELGWLKYFLAPMQDGKFQKNNMLHAIGKSIFVFAGGTCHTFEQFSTPGEIKNDSGHTLENEIKAKSKEVKDKEERFKALKVPDFMSRLRGYINILGPNKISDTDTTYVIRRAIVLRSIIEKKAKAIIDPTTKKVKIDKEVIRALLKVPRLIHGARSLEAIVEMSTFSDRDKYSQAALPPEGQLNMHVQEDKFLQQLASDIMFEGRIEAVAEDIHECYKIDNANEIKPGSAYSKKWDKLPKSTKDDNIRLASSLPKKLAAIGCGCRPVKNRPVELIKFTPEEIDNLARMEHEDWMNSKYETGWRPGEKRDNVRKIHPLLKPWAQLKYRDQIKNRKMVEHFPKHLEKVNYEIYRIEDSNK